MVGPANDILLNFVELVDAKDAACIFAIRSSLAPETRTKCYIPQWQIFDLENFILEHASDRHFRGTDEEGIIVFNGVYLVASLGELAVTNEAEFARHRRHDERGIPFPGYAVKSEVHQCQFKPGCIILEDVAARTSDLDTALDINHIQVLHNGIVIARLKVECGYLAPVLNRHVVILIFANGSAQIGYVGHKVEQLLTLLQKRNQHRFHAFDLFRKLLAFSNELLAQFLVFTSLCDLFRYLVLSSASFFNLALQSGHFSIDLQKVVDINIVVFKTGCFFHHVRMAANKSEI